MTKYDKDALDWEYLDRVLGAEPCPSSDHDGAIVPTTREVKWSGDLGITITGRYCSYCAEGFVARILAHGDTATIRPL